MTYCFKFWILCWLCR